MDAVLFKSVIIILFCLLTCLISVTTVTVTVGKLRRNQVKIDEKGGGNLKRFFPQPSYETSPRTRDRWEILGILYFTETWLLEHISDGMCRWGSRCRWCNSDCKGASLFPGYCIPGHLCSDQTIDLCSLLGSSAQMWEKQHSNLSAVILLFVFKSLKGPFLSCCTWALLPSHSDQITSFSWTYKGQPGGSGETWHKLFQPPNCAICCR